MIRLIDIRLNAAHPELPLAEAVTYTGAPSTMLIRGVSGSCGRWCITSVYAAATFPDGSTSTRTAVQSANGVWVATLPATNTSGRTVNGIRIMADGEDENGELVTGYILGVADFAVASLGVTPAPEPGGTAYALRYFDTLPNPAKKGDVIRISGDLKFYNGAAWVPFTDLSGYYTAEQTDNAIDKLAAYYITYTAAGAAFPTRADLLNAMAYYSGGELRVPTRNDYAVVLADESHGGAEWRYIYAVADGQTTGQWEAQYPVEGVITYDNTVTPNSGNAVKSSGIWSAIWGALASLPTGFTSLYDWCVAQLAGKLSKSGGNMTGLMTIETVDSPNLELRNTEAGSSVFLDSELSYTKNITYQVDIPFSWPNRAASDNNMMRHRDLTYLLAAYRAPMFDSTAQYAVGDFCRREIQGVQYGFRCVAGHTGGWNLEHFALVLLPAEIAALDAAFAPKLDSTSAAPAFDPTRTAQTKYTRNELVTKDGVVYKCTNASGHYGAWNASNWEAKPVSDLFVQLTGGTMTGQLAVNGSILVQNETGNGTVTALSYAFPSGIKLFRDANTRLVFQKDNVFTLIIPQTNGTLALTAASPTAGNLAALDSSGNPVDSQIPKTDVALKPANPTAGNLVKTTATGELQDAGYHFEVRNGIPCIVQYT